MRSADEWFELYGQSHQNKLNKAIHWVCIPVILVTTLGLFQSLPFPVDGHPLAHWGTVVVALGLVFYARLSWTLFAGMAAVSGAALAINGALVAAGVNLPLVSAAVFFVAWLFQFIGHKVEGAKPSFFEDLQFLLVGPAWLLQFVFKKVGIPVSPGDGRTARA
ncbi:MAG: DUF962 domain-containing protein [Deltaproteobacteria bacterium]|nr:MAG: DUF962 domain-containing protein [Deltaproteobacteria bacterium]